MKYYYIKKDNKIIHIKTKMESSRNINLDISSSQTFEAGVEVQSHIKFGKEFDQVLAPLNDRYKNSEITFGLRFVLVNNEGVDSLRDQINSFAEAFGVSNEALGPLGITWETRVEGNNFYVDLHVSGMTAESFRNQINYEKIVGLDQVDFEGSYNLTIATGLDPVKLLTDNLNDILTRALQFKIQGSVNTLHLENFFDWAVKFTESLGDNDTKNLALGFRLFAAFSSAGFNLNYDLNTVKEVVERFMGNKLGSPEMAQGMVEQYQMMANSLLPQAQGMAEMFIGPFKDLIKKFNVGLLEAHVYIPKIRTMVWANLNIPSLNDFVNQNFLN